MRTKIYLIRHGRQNSTAWNVDVPLSLEGREQAERVGKRLATFGAQAVYSSDLKRAVETADIINKYIKAERIIRPGIRESECGEMTGMPGDYVHERYADFFTKRMRMEEDIPYPGGENCEMVYTRAIKVIEEIVAKEYESVIVVTHGGTIRALLTGIVGAGYAKWITFGRDIENCSISEIMYDHDRKSYHIERFNDFAHIESEDRLLRKHFSKGY